MAQRHTDFAVRVKTVNRNDQVVTTEKSFKTDKARTKWLDDHDDEVVEVVAFSDPQ